MAHKTGSLDLPHFATSFLRSFPSMVMRHVGLVRIHVRRMSTSPSVPEWIPERIQQYAVTRLTSDLQQTWLSADIVDTPTCSILDPLENWTPSSHNNYPREIQNPLLDPFQLVEHDIQQVSSSINTILGDDHPILRKVAQYFFQHDSGKKVRPTMLFHFARAAQAHREAQDEGTTQVGPDELAYIQAAQQRLAEITEMIHTATLLHDDVIDEADARRGMPSANKLFGDKMAILAGDFLLARSSICLARLRNLAVIELMSTAIEHLVKGEVMQMKPLHEASLSALEYYCRKNYYKTGSLMSNSCKSVLVLGGHSPEICDLGFAYGKHLGLAFQLIDDVLDFDTSNKSGKPALADLTSGLATAPVLFAAQDFPELHAVIRRKFSEPGDIDLVLDRVERSHGLKQTKALALTQSNFAQELVSSLAPSPSRDALQILAQRIIHRVK